mmetsp:Transcript_7240/g.26633  ORF Transcript_7240/g.26633 Transcript_7240/m.26633 type:complete len:239 (+) Transcript_7240:100-816(+)
MCRASWSNGGCWLGVHLLKPYEGGARRAPEGVQSNHRRPRHHHCRHHSHEVFPLYSDVVSAGCAATASSAALLRSSRAWRSRARNSSISSRALFSLESRSRYCPRSLSTASLETPTAATSFSSAAGSEASLSSSRRKRPMAKNLLYLKPLGSAVRAATRLSMSGASPEPEAKSARLSALCSRAHASSTAASRLYWSGRSSRAVMYAANIWARVSSSRYESKSCSKTVSRPTANTSSYL